MIIFYCSRTTSLLLCTAIDTFGTNQSIRDKEGESLVSAGGSFKLGFFSPGGSRNRYLGIWYKNTATGTVVWVANGDSPLNDTSGVLKLTQQGSLVLLNGTQSIIWSSNSSKFTNNFYPIAQLAESGNLVVKDGNDTDQENFLWQSFDFPSETFLPGMKFGLINRQSGQEMYLYSWKSNEDPARGDYEFRINPSGYPQYILKKGSVEKCRLGPWNGVGFNGMPNLKPNPFFQYEFVFSQEEIYYRYMMINSSVVSRIAINPNGIIQRYVWINRTQGWTQYSTAQTDNCDTYALCGAYGSCNIGNSPACGCLKGFVPKYPQQWQVADWSNGCVRKNQLDCGSAHGFLKYSNVKIPDTRHSYFNESMNLEECKSLCLKNCSCTAYASMDIRGSGCLLWFGDLIDIREFNQPAQDLYVKMDASELDKIQAKKQSWRIIIGSVLSAVLLVSLGLILYIFRKKKKQQVTRRGTVKSSTFQHASSLEHQKENLELPMFDLATIAKATNNFSSHNKLGQGGFGPVYKGVLEDGQEIAVKTLSKHSGQGDDEFKNEAIYIARLQHRNLVKLLGCCIQGDGKILIYEYMPNKSLDYFIFDQNLRLLLDWPQRFHIIKGIARGLLYLHHDSRLRIIHRDLKASNILLDYEMNPKISDFGLARSFGEYETEANTRRVVGTYGYMAPEYAADGLFSIKSDVFSFGVLVLEIISGSRNRLFNHRDHSLNLLGHGWKLFTEGRSMEFIDASMEVTTHNPSELLRAIQVGLLCVQQCPEHRPNMSSVVLMLAGEGALPEPTQPGFYAERNLFLEREAINSSQSRHEQCSANMVTMTSVDAR